MEIVLSIHIGNVYLYFHRVEKNNQTQVSMTTKNIIFFRLRKTGPKIYVVVNIVWPDIRRSRFFLKDSWHFGVRLFSGGSYVGKRKGLTSARTIAVTRCTGLRFTYSFLWKKRVYPDLLFFVRVGYFFVHIIAEEGATCRTSGWTGFTVIKLTVVIVGVCM